MGGEVGVMGEKYLLLIKMINSKCNDNQQLTIIDL